MRREDGEGEDSDTDEEVFDNPSDAGRREETVELIKLLAGEYCIVSSDLKIEERFMPMSCHIEPISLMTLHLIMCHDNYCELSDCELCIESLTLQSLVAVLLTLLAS